MNSTDEWIEKMSYIYTHIYMMDFTGYIYISIYNGILFGYKRRKSCHLQQYG